MSAAMFGDMVKAVVDVRREMMAVDAELHSDEEAFLLEHGSAQEDLWGINLYPEVTGEGWIKNHLEDAISYYSQNSANWNK